MISSNVIKTAMTCFMVWTCSCLVLAHDPSPDAGSGLPAWSLAEAPDASLQGWSAPASSGSERPHRLTAGGTSISKLSVPVWWGGGFRPVAETRYVFEVVYRDVVKAPAHFLALSGLGNTWELTELHRFGGTGDGAWKTARMPCSWDLICRRRTFGQDTGLTELGIQSEAPLPVTSIRVVPADADAEARFGRETRDWVSRVQTAKRAEALATGPAPTVPATDIGPGPLVPYVRSYLVPLLPTDAPAPGEAGSTLRLRMARNELETGAFAVYAHGADLAGVEATLTPLKGSGGELRAEIRTAEYAVVREAGKHRLWPQRFWPAFPVDIPDGRSHAFWLTAGEHGDPANPGRYEGRVIFRAQGAAAELEVVVDVLPAMLPTMQEAGFELGGCGFPSLQDMRTLVACNHTGMDLWYHKTQPGMRLRGGRLELDFVHLDDWMCEASRLGMTHLMWFLGGDPYGFPDTLHLERELYRAQTGDRDVLRRAFIDQVNAEPGRVPSAIRGFYADWARQVAIHAGSARWPRQLILHPFDEPAKWAHTHGWKNAYHPVRGSGPWINDHFKDACSLLHKGIRGHAGVLVGGDMHHAASSLVFLDDVDVFCTNAAHEDADLAGKVRAADVAFWQYSGCADHSPAYEARRTYGWYFAACGSRASLVWAFDATRGFDTSEGEQWGYGWRTPFGTVQSPYLIGLREGLDDRRWIEAYTRSVVPVDRSANTRLAVMFRTALEDRSARDANPRPAESLDRLAQMDVWRDSLADAVVQVAFARRPLVFPKPKSQPQGEHP